MHSDSVFGRTCRLACILAMATAACSSPSADTEEKLALIGPTNSECPEDSTLNYENFGRPFMSRYCTGCHTSRLSGSERHGAPSNHNLDTLDAITAIPRDHIDLYAAGGPTHVNTVMPPGDFEPKPLDEERRDLGEWLACGTP